MTQRLDFGSDDLRLPDALREPLRARLLLELPQAPLHAAHLVARARARLGRALPPSSIFSLHLGAAASGSLPYADQIGSCRP